VKTAHVGPRVEGDHADRALVVEEGRCDQAADAGHHQTRRVAEFLVGGDVADLTPPGVSRSPPRAAFATGVLRRVSPRAPRRGAAVAAGRVAKHDDAFLGARSLESAIEDQLEQLGQRHRAAERPVNLVEQFETLRMAAQRRRCPSSERAPASRSAARMNTEVPGTGAVEGCAARGAPRSAMRSTTNTLVPTPISSPGRAARAGHGDRIAARSGARAQVLEPPGSVGADQAGMAARRRPVGEHDVALFGPPMKTSSWSKVRVEAATGSRTAMTIWGSGALLSGLRTRRPAAESRRWVHRNRRLGNAGSLADRRTASLPGARSYLPWRSDPIIPSNAPRAASIVACGPVSLKNQFASPPWATAPRSAQFSLATAGPPLIAPEL